MTKNDNHQYSAFQLDGMGYKKYLSFLYEEVRNLYQEDPHPWVIGYSGGKDSTAVLQLIWLALEDLPADERNKKIYIISTDTLVENPVVARWVRQSLNLINHHAQKQDMPFEANLLHPETTNSFWVNLIGRGYPRPWSKFRWCTDRLKIEPSNKFIEKVANQYGETILALGTRKYESAKRASNMRRHEKHRLRDRLSPNKHVDNCLIYTPIEDWTNDDVWAFLMDKDNPWGLSNSELLELYKDATEDRECPMIIELDEKTPSCGKSRFGCWTCTLVTRDSSLENMATNDKANEWLLPLIQYRNHLTVKDDKKMRDFRRMKGSVEFYKGKPIHGPYLQSQREIFLRQLLKTEKTMRQNAPMDFGDISLISIEELKEIRRIWLVEKHEIEDRLPVIYKDETGKTFPGTNLQHYHCFGEEELKLLEEICGPENRLSYEMIRELLDLMWEYQTKLRRAGLYDRMEQVIRKAFYDSKDDAVNFTKQYNKVRTVEEDKCS
ncbi:DNA phosphorothioation system sulfurtransferase DndC [Maridesulfovibrio sp.]|uniref:DNA phosphorothioation system sulfurtransferase DndC n=1 Tax=Maridesulfovibrio sp. TaxID=2795000 RepID=UPI0029F4DEA0|nr:DNA phosphorothioation system sulfurtransferase DndC [Maridesulfovibrio sp.]